MPKARVFHTDRFTRGGQVFSHEWRMRIQNLRVVFSLSLIFGIMGVLFSIKYYHLSLWQVWDFYILSYVPACLKMWFCTACRSFILWCHHELQGLGGAPLSWLYPQTDMTELTLPNQAHVHLSTLQFLQQTWVRQQAAYIKQATVMAFAVWCSGLVMVYYGFKYKSRTIEAEKLLAGHSVITARKLRWLLRVKRQASSWKIAPQLPLVKNSETQHIMVIGTTGSGKTNCIHGLLKQIADRQQRAIIVDTNCGYVNRYYNPARGDIIVNPFDSRSVCWQLWQDCRQTSDFDQLAAALIPEPAGAHNPVWHKNAREIVSTTAEKLALDGNTTLQALVEYASWKAVKNVKSFFKNTPIESLMNASGRAEETVHSVRMQMTEAMKRLALIPQEGTPFGIREWVTRRKDTSWLFISCAVNDRATLGTLMKFWVSIAIQALLERGEDHDHRLWFILDELFSLEGGAVQNLYTLLSEGRKYGGCGVLGFQSLGSLEKAQGSSGMKDIVSLCNTKVIFKTPEPHFASYLSKTLGEKDIIEATESLSVGSHHMRDGVSMASNRRSKPVVSSSDIMNLSALTSYITLAGDYPICKTRYTINKVPLIHQQQDYQRSISLLSRLESLWEQDGDQYRETIDDKLTDREGPAQCL